ncbi:MAG: cyclic nucleotide-binding domain-containing protein [Chloroflexota bacterium]|nr:cyclic nucleotide-binding domain-containing protein [Chloroflexota bacterium]
MSQELASRLREISIFSFLSSEESQTVASLAQVEHHPRGAVLCRQGDPGDKFYVILSGQVRVWVREPGKRARVLNYHAAGDFFGELALFSGNPRSATVDVIHDVELVSFDQRAFERLLILHPRLGQHLRTWTRERMRVSNRPFPGKQWDEVAVVFARKHWIALVESLWPLATVLLISGALIAALYVFLGTRSAATVGLVSFLILFVWGWWLYVDWINDDYIVTTKRVIHIERILFIREERHEAPLEQIQDVTVETPNAVSRIFDFRSLVIQTAGLGPITFAHLPNAERITNLIFQVRKAALERRAAEEKGQIRESIRESLGLPEQSIAATPSAPSEPDSAPQGKQVTRKGTLGSLASYIVPHLREEAGEQVIWRKHWLVLTSTLWPPVAGILFSIALLVAIPLYPGPLVSIPEPLLLLAATILLISSVAWYLWRYDGWRNEVYIVTDTRVIDVAGSPFRIRGESRREGTFDVIQTIYYDIPNFFARLVNIGNVYIDTAGTSKAFTFEHVYAPSSVQEEIFRRMVTHRERTQQAARKRQREEFSEWFGIYHQETEKSDQAGSPFPPVE